MVTVGIREAARLLGVSTDTIRRRIERRDLPAHKDASGRWLIDLDDSLMAQAAPAAPEMPSGDREELIRLRAENEALHVLLDEVRTSRDRTVEAEAELRRIIAVLTLRQQGLPVPEQPETEMIGAPEPPRRWWHRRRPEGEVQAGERLQDTRADD
ncbi:MAG TPA: helix-turn-helix domain-containing protein [Candidatus Dormibacteraeota bacterium]|jgi:excisionase family DNA binding protein|nr:helix-turn-helix domain-containing protein [Candidatus Dormibacteraeota bacterium]